MIKGFIEQNKLNPNKSQDLENKIKYFQGEIRKLTVKLISLRLKYQEENN